MQPTCRVRFAVAAAIALSAADARAYNTAPTHWDPATLPVPYRVNADSAPASVGAVGALAAVRASFEAWSQPACTAYRTRYDGPSTRAYVATTDGENTVLWITGPAGSWPPELGDENVTLASTTTVSQGQEPFVEADMRFNAVGFTWSLDAADGTVDLQSIATHEAGHFLGLAHSLDPSAVMYATYSGGMKRDLGADDVAGVCAIYPAGCAAGACDSGAADAADSSLADVTTTDASSRDSSGADAADDRGGTAPPECGCRAGGERPHGVSMTGCALAAIVIAARRRSRQLL